MVNLLDDNGCAIQIVFPNFRSVLRFHEIYYIISQSTSHFGFDSPSSRWHKYCTKKPH